MLDNITVNDAQYEAITHGAGAMLVLAGPGSGKTFVTTHRIKYLIEYYHINPEDILVITFTKAAALEMQERFIKLAEGKNYPVHFGTFHAIFFQILRHTYQFTAQNIIREQQKYQMITEIITEMPSDICMDAEEEETDKTLQDQQLGSGLSVEYDKNAERIEQLLAEISKVKNNGLTPQEYISETVTQSAFEYIFSAYKQEMNRRRLVDFDDMVLLCRNLLTSRPDVCKMWQERYSYILVDEFQDICPLQYEVVRLLAQPQNNLFIVGDDDQSIYGFRGSKPEIMLNFTKDYPKARQVLLNVNYRSKKDIVDTAAILIGHNQVRFSKEVQTQNPQTDGVNIYAFSSKIKQTESIVRLIRQYMEQPGTAYSDIAILYRTNSHTAHIADRLMQAGIPFTVKEKPKSIYNSAIARDMTAYMSYALYENRIEDFYRIMNRPVRYIRRNTVPARPFCMQELIDNNQGTDYVVQNIIKLYEQFRFIRQQNPFAAVNYIRKGVGYDSYVKKQASEQGRDATKELEELDVFSELAKEFETIAEWLKYIKNYDAAFNNRMQKNCPQQESDAVQIVTIHASKGLEWNVVILPDVNEGVVPHKKAVRKEELEEERRMFYVAMTRAKNNLFMFYVHEKEAGNLLPSRFLDEMN